MPGKTFLITAATLFFYTLSAAQSHEFRARIMMNDGSGLAAGIIVFPLLKDTVAVDTLGMVKIDISLKGRDLFYYRWGDWKSRMYRFPGGTCADTLVDVVVPDNGYYTSFAGRKICPVCLSGRHIIPVGYGYPSPAMFRKAKKGKVYLAGCIISENAPKAYCKKDDFEF